jgi:transposase-like protein
MYIPMPSPTSSRISIQHSAEFKTKVVMACGQAGASIAAIALGNGVNANLVHRWIRERRNGVVWADGEMAKYVVRSDEFNQAIIARCQQPGSSITVVAYSHGLRPAAVHKWIQGAKRTVLLPRLNSSLAEGGLPVSVAEAASVSREPNAQEKPSLPRAVFPAEPEAEPIVLEISGARLSVPVCRENFLETLRALLEHLK